MSVGGLSLESMLAMAQAQSNQRRQAAQEAAQAAKQAQQSQQGQQAQPGQQAQQGVDGAQSGACHQDPNQVLADPAQAQPQVQAQTAQAQDVMAQQQACQQCHEDAASANDEAGAEWKDFKADSQSDKPVANNADVSDSARDALYTGNSDAQKADASAPANENASANVDASAPADAQKTPSKLEALQAQKPNLKTNQDLINHCYAEGKNWEGASKVARDLGTTMGNLVRNRSEKLPSSPSTVPSTDAKPASTDAKPASTDAKPATTDAKPATTTEAKPATTEAPRAQGVDRPIKGFREVDVNKLRDQLPANAKHLAQAFVDSGRKHNVDPIALAAISKHETGNFTSSAFKNKNNAMGISNSRGPTQQPSAEASIDKMAKLLGSTTSGPYKNAKTIGETANIYAPIGAGNDPRGLNNHWAKGVAKFADDFERKVGAAPTSTTTGGTKTSGATTPSGGVDERQSATSGQNGNATIERTTKTGQRNQMVEGSITVNGNTYKFRSGGHGRGSLPKGQYEVTRHLDSRSDKRSMMVDGVGYSFALSDKFDSRVGDTRKLLRIHPDGNSPGTEGCIGIVGDAATQRRFREDMLAEIRRNGGSYTLNVN